MSLEEFRIFCVREDIQVKNGKALAFLFELTIGPGLIIQYER